MEAEIHQNPKQIHWQIAAAVLDSVGLAFVAAGFVDFLELVQYLDDLVGFVDFRLRLDLEVEIHHLCQHFLYFWVLFEETN